ncbi:MAG: hypothetical protein ACT4QA_19885 [Panacagrimonas sp.]
MQITLSPATRIRSRLAMIVAEVSAGGEIKRVRGSARVMRGFYRM